MNNEHEYDSETLTLVVLDGSSPLDDWKRVTSDNVTINMKYKIE